MLYPLRFKPIFKPRIWGGRRLAELFDKPLPPDQPIGESWELSGLAGDESEVADGPLAGQKLGELVERFGAELLGHAELIGGQFPLLIKLLDARENLSVQVHPGSAQAAAGDESARPKHEAWYVLDAEPEAKIWIGLKAGVTRERFGAAVEGGRVGDLLHAEPARVGEAFYLPGGTVHALGAGLVVAEVQTPSDTTWRVYDWGRTDEHGRARELHVDQAVEAIDYSGPPLRPKRSHVAGVFTTVTQLVKCENFTLELVRFVEGVEQDIPYAEMVVWQVLSGEGEVRWPGGEPVAFRGGELILLPASLRDAKVFCRTDCTWLEVTVPTRVAPGPGNPRRLPVIE